MKRIVLFVISALLLLAPGLQAQWMSKSWSLSSGWNGIWLPGDASYSTVEQLVTNPNVTEIWRWNPNPDQVQFSQDPGTASADSAEWTIWKRNDPNEKKLSRLVANSAYLVRTSAATTLDLKMLVRPPSATWLISGANFQGFPSAPSSTNPVANAPTISSYFSSFISGNTVGLPNGTKVYKYVGGELNANNPLQVVTSSEVMDPGKAYWFSLSTVNNFTGPLEYEVPTNDGLAFGRTRSTISVGVTNRSTVERTIKLSLDSSDSAPSGQPAVAGSIPLTRRSFDSTANTYTYTTVPATTGTALSVTVPANGRINLDFALDHTQLPASTGQYYAAILRLRDTANLTDVRLPVSAEPATAGGLWLCDVSVNRVNNTASPGSDSSTSRAFPLSYLIHVDASQNARLLRQAFVGQLAATTGNPMGVAVIESRVLGYSAAAIAPKRYYAPSMPVSGEPPVTVSNFASGTSATWTISHGYQDPANPFVHTYHPDHDNRDAKFSQTVLAAGKESYSIGRTASFSFTSSPPDGSSVSGWGTTVLGGNYTETLTGLNKQALQVSGTFSMRRISEIAEIDTSTTAPNP